MHVLSANIMRQWVKLKKTKTKTAQLFLNLDESFSLAGKFCPLLTIKQVNRQQFCTDMIYQTELFTLLTWPFASNQSTKSSCSFYPNYMKSEYYIILWVHLAMKKTTKTTATKTAGPALLQPPKPHGSSHFTSCAYYFYSDKFGCMHVRTSSIKT